ncbi:MAG: hypothetical protein SFW66_09125 [Gammaproteobacteria bacterium]|nr:hypothetical protein [Gammaproteobacteria bacterium]
MLSENQQPLLNNQSIVPNSLFAQNSKKAMLDTLKNRIRHLQGELDALTSKPLNEGYLSSSCGVVGSMVSYGVAQHNYLSFISTSGSIQCGLAWIPFCILGTALDGLVGCCQRSRVNHDIEKTTEQLHKLITEFEALEHGEEKQEHTEPPRYIHA